MVLLRILAREHWTRVRVQPMGNPVLRLMLRVRWTLLSKHLQFLICVARNVLHNRGEEELKFDVNEEAWPNADLANRWSYEGALIDGPLADKVKAGDEREITKMKDLQLYPWVKEADVLPGCSVLLTGWARRMKGNEVTS